MGHFEGIVGKLDYENSLWENLRARVGLCVVISAIVALCLIIAVVYSVKRKLCCCQKQIETRIPNVKMTDYPELCKI